MIVYCTYCTLRRECHARAPRHGDSETESNDGRCQAQIASYFPTSRAQFACSTRRQVDEGNIGTPCSAMMHIPGSNSVWQDPSTPRVLSDGTPLKWIKGTFSSGAGGRCLDQESSLDLSLCVCLSTVYPSVCPVCLVVQRPFVSSLGQIRHPWPARGPGSQAVSMPGWRARTGARGASQPASVGFVASEKDEGPAGVLVRTKRGQKVSSRLARA